MRTPELKSISEICHVCPDADISLSRPEEVYQQPVSATLPGKRAKHA